jgi:hypothetical protein
MGGQGWMDRLIVILAGPEEMNVDVVVTTRTFQKEHKNRQRLSLVRSSA